MLFKKKKKGTVLVLEVCSSTDFSNYILQVFHFLLLIDFLLISTWTGFCC